MAKAGKKVLILEQHDQAGGCCHTFIDKGYEFDVGIHYIGKMGHPNINKTYMDQICDGQVEWKEMEVNIFFKVHSFLKQCLHDLHFMKITTFHQTLQS